MRVIILLLLGLLTVGSIFYGARLLWRFARGSEEMTGQEDSTAPLDPRLGRSLLLIAALLFALMLFDRLQFDGEVPADWTVAPLLHNTAPPPDQPY